MTVTMRGGTAAWGGTSAGTRVPEPVQPRTATERRLQEIWERLLRARSPGVRDSFSDAGGNAHLFAELLTEIRSAFGILAEGLPVNSVADAPTIEGLAQLIDANREPVSSPVVCLQPSESHRALFLIHAGGGYVFFYNALASRLAPDYNVYGVQVETHPEGRRPDLHQCQNIEELAARYVDHIRAVQPVGPYALGGASLGGAVAFEMAKVLRRQGEAVAPVLLFSTLVRNESVNRDPDTLRPLRGAARVRRRLRLHLGHAVHLGPARGVGYLSGKVLNRCVSEAIRMTRTMRRALGIAASGAADELSLRQHRARPQPIPRALMYRCSLNLKIGNRLLSTYVPAVYDGRIVVFRAADDSDPEPTWKGLAREGMAVYDMPGGHLDMMEEPLVRTTADLVRRQLRSALDPRRVARPAAARQATGPPDRQARKRRKADPGCSAGAPGR